jgi:hypothetical protein
VGDVFEVLRASHYHLLTNREWELAQSQSFELIHPVEVDWSYMDGALLRRFWESTPTRKSLRSHLPDEVGVLGRGGVRTAGRGRARGRKQRRGAVGPPPGPYPTCKPIAQPSLISPTPPEKKQMADRILVFHRGIGSAKRKGLLINEKLDLLCEFTVLRLIDAVLSRVPKRFGGTKPDAPPKGGGGARALHEQRSLRPSASLARAFSTLQGRVTGNSYVASEHKYAKVGAGSSQREGREVRVGGRGGRGARTAGPLDALSARPHGCGPAGAGAPRGRFPAPAALLSTSAPAPGAPIPARPKGGGPRHAAAALPQPAGAAAAPAPAAGAAGADAEGPGCGVQVGLGPNTVKRPVKSWANAESNCQLHNRPPAPAPASNRDAPPLPRAPHRPGARTRRASGPRVATTRPTETRRSACRASSATATSRSRWGAGVGGWGAGGVMWQRARRLRRLRGLPPFSPGVTPPLPPIPPPRWLARRPWRTWRSSPPPTARPCPLIPTTPRPPLPRCLARPPWPISRSSSPPSASTCSPSSWSTCW